MARKDTIGMSLGEVRRLKVVQEAIDRHITQKMAASMIGLSEPQSQFQRALKELGVKVIHAHSPQAKGRVERLFKTLQDRLIKEMRLRGITTAKAGEESTSLYTARSLC